MRKTKIIATIGPVSCTLLALVDLIEAGIDVARINMSHGTRQEHLKTIENIREASKKTKKEIAILIDLQGPKIRVDALEKPLTLKEGEVWAIGPSHAVLKHPEFKHTFIPTAYEGIADKISEGDTILFDDGRIAVKAVEKNQDIWKVKITTAGSLGPNKGINLPHSPPSIKALTPKDHQDILFAIENDCDYLALSFVQQKKDILELKDVLAKHHSTIPIVAKIERPHAIDNLDDIILVSDAVMVARGDLGVEIGNHLVPLLQKKIINRCNEFRKPVITATQMLDSMTYNPLPSRAESSDVANAIWDGTDAVMLSSETATGKYPLQAVKIMGAIILEAEKEPKKRPLLRNLSLSNVGESVMVAASMVAEKIYAKKILALTESGMSCYRISLFRPHTPVVAITNKIKTARRVSLYWGVDSLLVHALDDSLGPADIRDTLLSLVCEKYPLKQKDRVVITRGEGKLFATGTSNSLKVEII